MGAIIRGSAIAVPDHIVTNHDLAKIMDTTDEWIQTRTGVAQRHVAAPGVGPSDLGAQAVQMAAVNAGVELESIDLLIVATMTPDHFAPGPAPLVQRKAGLGHIAAFDVRQQCGGFLYALDLADAYLSTGRASRAAVVGAEVHAGYMPYGESGLAVLRGEADEVNEADRAAATAARAWSVLFGDGAGAMILDAGTSDNAGLLSSCLYTDGDHFDLIHVEAPGFLNQPYLDEQMVADGRHLPQMNGMELFRQAVTRMPESVSELLDRANLSIEDVDLLVAHQANARILEGVRKQLGINADRVASAIDRYANTTAATLPIAYHDHVSRSPLESGSLVAFTAFGAGAHWGAALYREP